MPVNYYGVNHIMDHLGSHCRVERNVGRDVVTHTLLCGGTYCAIGDNLATLRERLAQSLSENGEVPPLIEMHSFVFPLYLDLDAAVLVPTVTDAALERIVRVIHDRICKYYRDGDLDPSTFDMIVLTKKRVTQRPTLQDPSAFTTTAEDATEAATHDPTPNRYKHGVHIHLPNLLVTAERALDMREGILMGLNMNDWTVELGEARPNWADIVDKNVYGSSLRMIGAPKATKCDACKHDDRCIVCRRLNNKYVIDLRVYLLRLAFREGTRSDEMFRELTQSVVPRTLVERVSVRADGKAETPHFKLYDGCPRRSTKPGKRGRENGDPIPASHRSADVVSDPVKLGALKDQLMLHSERYAECTVNVARVNKGSIYVTLIGDGATYCLNKRDFHNRNRVYMLVRRSKGANTYESVMRCYCKCAAVRPGEVLRIPDGRFRIGGPCSDFFSSPRTVPAARAALLFATSSSSSSSMVPSALGGGSGTIWEQLRAMDREISEILGP